MSACFFRVGLNVRLPCPLDGKGRRLQCVRAPTWTSPEATQLLGLPRQASRWRKGVLRFCAKLDTFSPSVVTQAELAAIHRIRACPIPLLLPNIPTTFVRKLANNARRICDRSSRCEQ